MIFLFIAPFFIYFLSSDESDFLKNESDKIESHSGSYGTYSFCACYLRAEESVASVLVYDVFAPTGFKTVSGIFVSDVFAPTGVDSKVGRLLVILWRPN